MTDINKLALLHRLCWLDNGLTLADSAVLVEISQLSGQYGFATNIQVSENVGINHKWLYVKVKSLIKSGFVVLTPTPNVYVSHELRLSSKGRVMVKQIYSILS